MTRTHAFFVLALFLALVFPHFAFAQNDLVSNTGVIDVTYICDTVNGDDGCYLEGFAVIYGDTSSLNLHGLSQTSVSADSFDDGWDGYVVGDVLQDGKEIAGPSQAGDNGQGVSVIIWNVAINLNATHVFDVRTDSYYNYIGNAGCAGGGTCVYIASAQQMVTLGRPAVTSVSPPYVFVGTTGTLTLNGSNFVNPFGNPTSISASKTSGTGFSVSTGTVGSTQASAPYTAALTATTGNWDIGLTYSLGSSILISTFGSFTVGDPTPTISSISPSSWAAGQVNIPVTIKGSGFGSNPQLVIAGVTSTITGHSDNGQPGGAVITANVSVPGCATGTAGVTVTSEGYNGTGFGNAYPGQPSYVVSTATITPAAALAPNIGGTKSPVVAGQLVSLTGTIPTQPCTTATTWNWQLPAPQGTTVGGYHASTAGGVTLDPLPVNTNPSYAFYWVYPGTFSVTAQYTLVNGQVSPTSTATFTVKGLTGGPLSNTNYGSLTVDNLTGCPAQPAGPYLVYGNVKGPVPGCPGQTTGTPGIVFDTSKYGQPSAGTFSWVQLISADTTIDSHSDGTKVTCTTSAGIDLSYPYGSHPTPTTANDAPEAPLPSTFATVSRSFTATMYPLWTSSVANSIPIPIGNQGWQFSGQSTQVNGKWQKPTGSGTVGTFTAGNGNQPNHGYPSWTGKATQTCH
jgi:hypothetical protein